MMVHRSLLPKLATPCVFNPITVVLMALLRTKSNDGTNTCGGISVRSHEGHDMRSTGQYGSNNHSYYSVDRHQCKEAFIMIDC
eukprot:10512-Heterococcus_DN1.PRE.2